MNNGNKKLRLFILVAMMVTAILSLAVILGSCTLVIGDRNKVEAPDTQIRARTDVGRAHTERDEKPDVQTHEDSRGKR